MTNSNDKITSVSDVSEETHAAPVTEVQCGRGGSGGGGRGGRGGRGRPARTDAVTGEVADNTANAPRGRRGGGIGGGRGSHPTKDENLNSQATSGIEKGSAQQDGKIAEKSARGGGCPHKTGCPHWKDGELKLSGTGKPENRRGGHGNNHGSHPRAHNTAGLSPATATAAAV